MASQNIITKLNSIGDSAFPNVNNIKTIASSIESAIDENLSLLDDDSISFKLDEVISSYESKLKESMNSIGAFGTIDPLVLIDSLAQLRSLREYINTKKVVSNYLKKRNMPTQIVNRPGPNNARTSFGPTRSRSSSPVRGGRRRQTKRRRNSRR